MEIFLLITGAIVVGAVLADHSRASYEVVMVLLGAGLGLLHLGLPQLTLSSNLILTGILPALLMPAAVQIRFHHLRPELGYILLLSTIGVLVAAAVGTLGFMGIVGWPLTWAAVLGIALAATDPISVVALFKKMGAPERVSVTLDAEALLNDGTSVVLFKATAAALGLSLVAGQAAPAGGSFGAMALQTLVQFAIVGVGSAVLGASVGWLWSLLPARINNVVIEAVLSVYIAYATTWVAERLYLSGVIAVVVAGLVFGNVGGHKVSAHSREGLQHFWGVVEFVMVGLVFLLIGQSLQWHDLLDHWREGLGAIVVATLGRAISVYLVTWPWNRLTRNPVPLNYQHVLFWGGLRGGVALAVVLALPAGMPGATAIRVACYFVVLWTNLVQGLTTGWLGRKLGVIS